MVGWVDQLEVGMAKRAPGGANKFLALQMETDLVSALLRIGEGGINFFASCLL